MKLLFDLSDKYSDEVIYTTVDKKEKRWLEYLY